MEQRPQTLRCSWATFLCLLLRCRHVAVRVAHDDVTPALRLPLKTRETYYMLNDFNAHHHHAVLAGQSKRYSSTHRVAVVAKDTWAYIRGRCQVALAAMEEAGGAVVDSNAIRRIGEVHIEVEMQWLRMFWIQGRRHATSHDGFWLPCMEKLERWWRLMEDSLKGSLGVSAGSVPSPATPGRGQESKGVPSASRRGVFSHVAPASGAGGGEQPR